MHASANTPASNTIVFHADFDTDDTRDPQTQFVVERQVAFLEALATTGSVRAATLSERHPPPPPQTIFLQPPASHKWFGSFIHAESEP